MPTPPVRRLLLQGLGLLLALGALLGSPPAAAQAIEISALQATRSEGALMLEFSVRIMLPKAVEEALHHGVPVYFVAEADVKRSRWYWRDERVARVSRSWRVAFQPLTSTWRVGLGGLYQTVPTLPDAIAIISRSAGWRVADLGQLDPDSRYYIEFSYRLDNTQLPSPMQIGLGGQADWTIGVERTLRVEREP
jgi:hypothetical protein